MFEMLNALEARPLRDDFDLVCFFGLLGISRGEGGGLKSDDSRREREIRESIVAESEVCVARLRVCMWARVRV